MKRGPTRVRNRCVAMLVAAAATFAAPAFGQPTETDRTAARELAASAKDAWDGGDWARALELYRRAASRVSAPTLDVRVARCLVMLDRFAEARETYQRVVANPPEPGASPAFMDAVRQARVELATLESEAPQLTIDVRSGDARLTIDGVPVDRADTGRARPVDPGTHALRGTIDGQDIEPVTFTLSRGQRHTVTVGESPATSTTSSGIPPWAWVAAGVAGAGLAVGIGAGVTAVAKKNDLDDSCPGNVCPSSRADDIDAFRSFRTVSTIGYVVAFVAGTGAVVLVLTRPRAAHKVAGIELAARVLLPGGLRF